MKNQTFLEYAETPRGNMLLSAVSFLNNILSAENATDTFAKDGKFSETESSRRYD